MYSDNYFKALRKLANDNGRIGVPAVTPRQTKPVQPVKTLPDVSKDPAVQAGLDAYKRQLDATSPLNAASAGPVERLDMSDVGLSLPSLPGQLQDTVRREQRKEILTRKPQDRRTPEQVAQKAVYGTGENTTDAQHLANAEQSRRDAASLGRQTAAISSAGAGYTPSADRPAPGGAGRRGKAEPSAPFGVDVRQASGGSGAVWVGNQMQQQKYEAAQRRRAASNGKYYDLADAKSRRAPELDYSNGYWRPQGDFHDNVTGLNFTPRDLARFRAPDWRKKPEAETGKTESELADTPSPVPVAEAPAPANGTSAMDDRTPVQVGATGNTPPPTPREPVAEAPAMSYTTPAQVFATGNTPPPTPQEPVAEAPAQTPPSETVAEAPAPTPPQEPVAEAPATADEEAGNGAKRAINDVIEPDREQEVASNQMSGRLRGETARETLDRSRRERRVMDSSPLNRIIGKYLYYPVAHTLHNLTYQPPGTKTFSELRQDPEYNQLLQKGHAVQQWHYGRH